MVLPDNASNKAVTWSSSNPGAVKFVQGSSLVNSITATSISMKAVGTGTATITATAGGVTTQFTVTVGHWNITVPVTKPMFSVLSNKDIVINDLNATWKYISDDEFEDYKDSLFTTSTVVFEYLRKQYAISSSKGNTNITLNAKQLAILYTINKNGVILYLTAKSNSTLTKSVYKELTGKDPQYYSLIDGEWNPSNTWSTSSYSEAEAALTYDRFPPNLVALVTVGLITVSVISGIAEAALFIEGVSVFGFRTALIMYDYGVLASEISYMQMDPQVIVRHAVANSGGAQSVINGIDPGFFRDGSRFGKGFYVAVEGNTAVAEVAAHDGQAAYVIRFNMNLAGQKMLNLKDSAIASQWGFSSASSYAECQAIALSAQQAGYNIISWPSFQTGGVNYVIYNNFTSALTPVMISPVG